MVALLFVLGAPFIVLYVLLPVIAFYAAVNYETRGALKLIIGNLIFWPIVFLVIASVGGALLQIHDALPKQQQLEGFVDDPSHEGWYVSKN